MPEFKLPGTFQLNVWLRLLVAGLMFTIAPLPLLGDRVYIAAVMASYQPANHTATFFCRNQKERHAHTSAVRDRLFRLHSSFCVGCMYVMLRSRVPRCIGGQPAEAKRSHQRTTT